MLSDLEGWCELDWAGLSDVQIRLPPVREKLRDMSHCLSDCWTTLDNTQRLLSTLTEVPEGNRRAAHALHVCGCKSHKASSPSCVGHSVVRRRLLPLLPDIFHLPPCVPSADSPVPLPGCPFLSFRARRWGAPGSLDTDCRAVPADCCPRQTTVPPVRPGPEPRPREAKDALCQQSLGPDGS